MFQIIDNYLKLNEHLILKTAMESNTFPWYFNEHKVFNENKLFHYQFVHVFYIKDKINSPFFNIVDPLIQQLKPLSLIRIKANLNPISDNLIEFEQHKDQSFKCKVAIYYLNDNDGYTMIGKEKINSKKNRMVLFDSTQEHYGTNSTNCKNRMVINFNYF